MTLPKRSSSPAIPSKGIPAKRKKRGATIDLTEWNAENSPLFRLPPELRNKIWAYAFLDFPSKAIYHLAPIPRKEKSMVYVVSSKDHTNAELYRLSLQGAASDDNTSYAAKALVADPLAIARKDICKLPFFHERGEPHDGDEPRRLFLPLVSKQVYFEAEGLMYETCSFAFHGTGDLHSFVFSGGGKPSKVRHLEIRLRSYQHLVNWPYHLVSRFTALEGLSLHLVTNTPLPWLDTRMTRENRFPARISQKVEAKKFLNFASLFQKLSLVEKHTHVVVYQELSGGLQRPVTDLLRQADEIRAKLLDYRPQSRMASKRVFQALTHDYGGRLCITYNLTDTQDEPSRSRFCRYHSWWRVVDEETRLEE